MLRFVGRITIKFQQHKKYDKIAKRKVDKVSQNINSETKHSQLSKLVTTAKIDTLRTIQQIHRKLITWQKDQTILE